MDLDNKNPTSSLRAMSDTVRKKKIAMEKNKEKSSIKNCLKDIDKKRKIRVEKEMKSSNATQIHFSFIFSRSNMLFLLVFLFLTELIFLFARAEIKLRNKNTKIEELKNKEFEKISQIIFSKNEILRQFPQIPDFANKKICIKSIHQDKDSSLLYINALLNGNIPFSITAKFSPENSFDIIDMSLE